MDTAYFYQISYLLLGTQTVQWTDIEDQAGKPPAGIVQRPGIGILLGARLVFTNLTGLSQGP